jgi:2-polyprenyl-6-methoxyphenol hydroxylase-like FAD-dependent oxidoreductase
MSVNVCLRDVHGMHVPAAGQGANSALESCKVLGSVLAEAGGDVGQVPQRFTSARLADMHALNELDAKAYSFFRCAQWHCVVVVSSCKPCFLNWQ